MKLKPGTLGLALAGAVALCSALPAEAQQRPVEPYYFTPKLLYSHTMMDSFETNGRIGAGGEFWRHSNDGAGRFKGGDGSDNSFGGGLSLGYDFGAYSEYPVRLELEYLHHGSVDGDYPSQMTSSVGFSAAGVANEKSSNVSTADFKIDSTIQTVMANVFLDFPTDTAFTPYIGGGIGGAYVDSKISGHQTLILGGNTGYYVGDDLEYRYGYDMRPSGSQNSWNFAWQLSAGFSYQFTDSMALDVSYRYSDYGSADFGSRKYQLYGETADPEASTAGTNLEERVIGTFSNKAKYDLSAHEIILGLRIMAF